VCESTRFYQARIGTNASARYKLELALRSRLIGKPPDSGSGDWRFESSLLSQSAMRVRHSGSHRLVVRTPASHVGNAGSTPAGITRQQSSAVQTHRKPRSDSPPVEIRLAASGFIKPFIEDERTSSQRQACTRSSARGNWMVSAASLRNAEWMADLGHSQTRSRAYKRNTTR
jgi:hypothetical protein